ncbi:MAG: hypothetical protein A3D13_06830 [Planctomycetes bacterium RIFCSPHIGHO2_02_FULL_40_12]|nr:MAG: hypothetical protein A3D13_06830 [Planctomycetes bacterium RIFCSPHIGHO2_02_FULL_40_12]
MRNYDNSLIEVWKWKEMVYEDTKGMSAKEYVEKVRSDANKILSENAIELTPISSLKKNIKKQKNKLNA